MKRRLKTAAVALLFGSERFGLSNEEMSHCHWLMRIPTRVEHGTMNLGQAVAICLYELVRAGSSTLAPAIIASASDKAPAATSKQMERLTQILHGVLHNSGYIKPRTVAAEEKLRRLVRRMKLNSNDAEVLVGMMRQIAWKLGALAANDTDTE